MTYIIDKLKKNPYNTVNKTTKKCPICNGDLYIVDSWLEMIMDGNAVYYCENIEEHKFWNHPFEDFNILHLNKNASSTNFESEQDYKYIDDKWLKI